MRDLPGYELFQYVDEAGEVRLGDRLLQIDPLSNEALTRGYWYRNSVDPEGAIGRIRAHLVTDDVVIVTERAETYTGSDSDLVSSLLGAMNASLAEPLTEADVVATWAGLRPLVNAPSYNPNSVSSSSSPALARGSG